MSAFPFLKNNIDDYYVRVRIQFDHIGNTSPLTYIYRDYDGKLMVLEVPKDVAMKLYADLWNSKYRGRVDFHFNEEKELTKVVIEGKIEKVVWEKDDQV